MKFRFFEFEDKPWLPKMIRNGMTDYLRFVLHAGNLYEPVSKLIVQLVDDTKATQVVDLGSGGGGAVAQIQKNIEQNFNRQIPFILTDLFPNISAYEFIKNKTNGKIGYSSIPVNAAQVPPAFKGVRTIFSTFHHFDNNTATEVIKNAVEAKEGMGIFDGGDKNILFVLAITLLNPIAFLLLTPFFRPFTWGRLLFTYIIPLIPLCTMWDGIVSTIRLYTPAQLLGIANSISNSGYRWQAGKVKNKFGMRITYLIGYPLKALEK